jgi:vitamin B12 transporter
MRKWLGIVLMAAASWPGAVAAQEAGAPEAVVMEEVVVTATRTPTPTEETGVSTTVFTRKEIEEKQATLVEEVLRSAPGVTVSQTGGRGGETSLFVRGGNSNNTQVLLNGIKLNDAGGAFDFSTLTVDNVNRIELIRGPMSSLYGADAMTGVVNLITNKGAGPPSLSLTSYLGAHSENGNLQSEQRASLTGAYQKFAYSIAFSRVDDQGLLNLNNRFYSNVLNARLDWDPKENLSFTFINMLIDSRAGFPTVNGGDRLDAKSAGGPGLDPDRNTTKTDLVLGLIGNYWPWKWWENELTIAYTRWDRHFNNPPNPAQTLFDQFFWEFTRDLEQHYNLDYHSNFRFGDKDGVGSITTFGVAARTEQLKSRAAGALFGSDFQSFLKASRHSTAFYSQEQLAFWDRFFLTGGFRLEDNSVFSGAEFTPRASAAFKVKETDTVLRAAGGRSIKEPTFIQTSSQDPSFLGNPNLKPEKNTSWEVGADQYLWKQKVKLGMTYFENHFTDFITFVQTSPFTGTFENIGAVRTTGLELGLKASPGWGLSLATAYTHLFQFTVLDDGGQGGLFFKTGKHVLRRPRNTFSFDAQYTRGRLGLHVSGLYTGRRDDSRFTFGPPYAARVVNGGFFVLNLAATYDVMQNWGYLKKVQLVARANNILDRFYEEVYGYSSPRFNAMAGVRVVY